MFNTIENQTGFLYDSFVSCDVNVDDTLCQNIDRNEYLREYESGAGRNILEQGERFFVRRTLNKHSWGITRDLVLKMENPT